MFLPCPNCGFLVALVTPKHGATEQRCPRCGQGLAPPLAGVEALTPTQPSGIERGDAIGQRGDPQHGRIAGPPETPVDAGPDPHGRGPVADASIVQSKAPSGHARRAPSFARRRAGAAPLRPRWPLHLASAALALLLALQLVLARRDVLAADTRWRPSIETLCGAFGCAVPAWHEPAAFTMLDRSVQPKAGAAGVLTARASFRNDARWPQPWPTLALSLSGIDGEPLGARAFTPVEYAGGPRPPLAPGQVASVQLDVVEPGPGVVAFAFDFR